MGETTLSFASGRWPGGLVYRLCAPPPSSLRLLTPFGSPTFLHQLHPNQGFSLGPRNPGTSVSSQMLFCSNRAFWTLTALPSGMRPSPALQFLAFNSCKIPPGGVWELWPMLAPPKAHHTTLLISQSSVGVWVGWEPSCTEPRPCLREGTESGRGRLRFWTPAWGPSCSLEARWGWVRIMKWW